MVFELFIRHELNSTVAHAKQRWYETTVESLEALCLPEMRCSLTNRLVCSRCVARCRQHACLDDPYRIGTEGSEDSGSAGSKKVIVRGKDVGVPSSGLDQIFDITVPKLTTMR